MRLKLSIYVILPIYIFRIVIPNANIKTKGNKLITRQIASKLFGKSNLKDDSSDFLSSNPLVLFCRENKQSLQGVKIDGFDGEMIFTISEYIEENSSISDGKRVDISLSFIVVLNKPSLSQTKLIQGYVSSYGTLSGNFSLAEFDIVIQNTQSDLVLRLSRDLKSKI